MKRWGTVTALAMLLAACSEQADPPDDVGGTESDTTTTTELQVAPGGNLDVADGFYPVGAALAGTCTGDTVRAMPAGGALVPDLDDANCFQVLDDGGLEPGIVESAEASIGDNGAWQVGLVLTEDGIEAFNGLAGQCADQASSCPVGQLAVVVRGRVVTAPQIQEASFDRDAIHVSGDFTPDEARQIAAALAG